MAKTRAASAAAAAAAAKDGAGATREHKRVASPAATRARKKARNAGAQSALLRFDPSPVTQSPSSSPTPPPTSPGLLPSDLDPPAAGPCSWPDGLLASTLSAHLSTLILLTPPLSRVPDAARPFFSVAAQPFALRFYVARLVQYLHCSPAAFVCALALLDRAAAAEPALTLSSLNVHRALSAAAVVAAKFVDDEVYANAYYARVCGLGAEELNGLEARLLEAVGWRVRVSEVEFKGYCAKLEWAAADVADDIDVDDNDANGARLVDAED